MGYFLLLLKFFKSCIDSTPEHFLYLVMGEKVVFLYLVMNALEDTLSNNLWSCGIIHFKINCESEATI